ncbi:hypothetical protein D3C81_1954440 [compost metagenome]
MQRRESPQREERHIGNPLLRQLIDQRIVATIHDVVEILHADNRRYALRLRNLRGSNIAQPNVSYQPLTL